MSEVVRFTREGEIGVITVANPPVNALSQPVRAGLKAAVETGLADAAVQAMVLICDGATFIAGADIREFGTPKAIAEPNLLSVILALYLAARGFGAAEIGALLTATMVEDALLSLLLATLAARVDARSPTRRLGCRERRGRRGRAGAVARTVRTRRSRRARSSSGCRSRGRRPGVRSAPGGRRRPPRTP